MTTAHRNSRGTMICIAAVGCSLVVPGAGHLLIRANTHRAKVLVPTIASIAATVALLYIVATSRSRTDVAEMVADRTRFLAVAVALVVLALTRLWTALDVAWAARPERGVWRTTLAAVVCMSLVAVGVTPLVVAADYVRRTNRAIDNVFGSEDAVVALPGTLPTSPDTSVSASTITPTTPAPFPGQDRVNILLLGGDAGKGRYSLRTDTMVVVSVDPHTGRTAMISVPRNLQRLPFPPGTPLAARYPRGFDDLANAVYPVIDRNRELAGGGDDAGALAIKQGIAQLLGIPIQYYVLVDMKGFINVVDALGGIDVTVTKRVPSPGNPYEAKHPVPAWFELGRQHMDGTVALAYARSRKADDDYKRMGRQRCVLAGIADAASPWALTTGLGSLMDAFGSAVRTDIPRHRLGDIVQLVERFSSAGGIATVDTLVLAPPVIQPSRWTPERIRALVAALLAPVPTDDGGTTTTAGPSPSTTSTTSVPSEVLADDCV
ncbi:MAG: LCP family protein [Actinomycetota bacterium]|nr:LCP family protein [Actinomycetota bacterium]